MPTAKYRPHRAALAEVAAAPVPALAVRFRIHRAEVRAGLNCGCDFRRHRYATTLEFDREIVWDSRSGSRSVDGLRARKILKDFRVASRAEWERHVPVYRGTPKPEMRIDKMQRSSAVLALPWFRGRGLCQEIFDRLQNLRFGGNCFHGTILPEEWKAGRHVEALMNVRSATEVLGVLTLPVFDLLLQQPIAVAGRRLQIAPVEDGDVPPRVGNQSRLL